MEQGRCLERTQGARGGGDSKPLHGAGGGGQAASFCFQMAAQHTQREAQRGAFELRETEAHPGARVQGHIAGEPYGSRPCSVLCTHVSDRTVAGPIGQKPLAMGCSGVR